MRVFYDHQVTSLQDAGGVSRYFYELAKALASNRQVNVELLQGFTNSAMPFGELAPAARILALQAHGKPGYHRYALNEALTAAIVPLRGRFDVYHATYQRALPYVRRRALVVTHHDSTPDRFPGLFPDAAAIHGRLARLYARADRILCISESSRQDLLEFYPRIDPEKTQVIYQGFSPLPGAGTVDLPEMPGGKPCLLYVGSRPAYKNFSTLLAALARLQNDTVWLLAMGGGAFTADEKQQIAELGLGSRMRLVPFATDAQLAAAYRSARLFIYPSLYEGFGFPPLEAMAAGCPALVSRTSALPEICGDAAFYFDPEKVEELADWIGRLLGDEALRLSKQAAGLAQVRHYDWKTTAAATLAAYEAAL